MDLEAVSGDLAGASRNVEEVWHGTREIWRDGAADYFESRFWQPLQASTHLAADEMSRLATITRQVSRRYRLR